MAGTEDDPARTRLEQMWVCGVCSFPNKSQITAFQNWVIIFEYEVPCRSKALVPIQKTLQVGWKPANLCLKLFRVVGSVTFCRVTSLSCPPPFSLTCTLYVSIIHILSLSPFQIPIWGYVCDRAICDSPDDVTSIRFDLLCVRH